MAKAGAGMLDTHVCPCLFRRGGEEVGEQHGDDYAVVEYDDLLGSGCRLLCCRGLLARLRDDDT